jgi:hypothetical protein
MEDGAVIGDVLYVLSPSTLSLSFSIRPEDALTLTGYSPYMRLGRIRGARRIGMPWTLRLGARRIASKGVGGGNRQAR